MKSRAALAQLKLPPRFIGGYARELCAHDGLEGPTLEQLEPCLSDRDPPPRNQRLSRHALRHLPVSAGAGVRSSEETTLLRTRLEQAASGSRRSHWPPACTRRSKPKDSAPRPWRRREVRWPRVDYRDHYHQILSEYRPTRRTGRRPHARTDCLTPLRATYRFIRSAPERSSLNYRTSSLLEATQREGPRTRGSFLLSGELDGAAGLRSRMGVTGRRAQLSAKNYFLRDAR